jgi:hypothetical protein
LAADPPFLIIGMLSSPDQLHTRTAQALFADYRKKAFDEKKCEKQATYLENCLESCNQESIADWKLPSDLRLMSLKTYPYPKYLFNDEKGKMLALDTEQRNYYNGLKNVVQCRRDLFVNGLKILREEKAKLIDQPYEALKEKIPDGLTDPERDFIVLRYQALRSSFEAKARKAGAVSSDLSSTQVEHPTQASQQDAFRDDDFLRDEDSMQVDNQGSDLRTLILSLKETVNSLSSRIVKIEKTPQKNVNPRSAAAGGGAASHRRSGSQKPTDNNTRRGRSTSRYDNRRSASSRRSQSSGKSVTWRRSNSPPLAAGGGRGSANCKEGRKDSKKGKRNDKK